MKIYIVVHNGLFGVSGQRAFYSKEKAKEYFEYLVERSNPDEPHNYETITCELEDI